MYDVIVIGSGPAGLTAGIFTTRRALKTLVLGDPSSLSQAEEAPVIDDYPGFGKVSGSELIKKMKDHARETGAELKDERVLEARKTKSGFGVKTEKTEHQAKTLIFATGARHRKALVPGEEEFSGRGVSYCASCDAPLYKNKKVLIIGGGDSAVIEALLLDKVGVHTTLVHRRDELRAAESLQKQLSKSGVKILWDTILTEIRGDKIVKSATLMNVKTKKKHEVKIDGVFVSIGTVPTSELAKKLGIKLDSSGYIIVDREQKTNVKGIFAAGDCCNNPAKKIASAVGDGAVAAQSAYDFIKSE